MSKSWGRFEPPEGWEREVPYDIRERAFQFAVQIIRVVRRLPDDAATRVVAYQLVKAATSVGANVEEADGAESKRDFVHKMSIARKEARESRYWIRIVRARLRITTNGSLSREKAKRLRVFSALSSTPPGSEHSGQDLSFVICSFVITNRRLA